VTAKATDGQTDAFVGYPVGPVNAADAEPPPPQGVPTGAGGSPSPTAKGWLVWIAIAAFGLVVIGLTLYAASGGVRGSDQYWYLADVETLARDHAMSTNTVFPVALLGSDPILPPPFIHNVLSLYLAAVPALALGPYGGWIALNLIATLATAGLIYLAARTVASRWAALVCALAYPLLPVTIWHTAQPLSEASTTLFAALAIYLLAIARTSLLRWLALAGTLGLLYFSRESYLPLLLAAPIGFLIVRVRERPARLREAAGPTLVLAATVVAIATSAQVVFAADNVRFSYTRLLHAAVPGDTSNMWFNFDLSAANLSDRLAFDPGLLVAKLGDHLAEQFIAFDNQAIALFYWTFNILAIVALVMLWRCRRRPLELRIVIGSLAFVAVHLVTIVLFQNQVRYTLPALPGLLVVFSIALSGVRPLARYLAPRTFAIIVGVTVMGLIPAGGLARILRGEAIEEGQFERATETLFAHYLGPDEPALMVYSGTPQVFAYAARPRLILYVSPDYTADEESRLRAAFPARWLFAPDHSPVLLTLPLRSGQPVGDVEAYGTHWGLYELGG
jgi:hypothetical protein